MAAPLVVAACALPVADGGDRAAGVATAPPRVSPIFRFTTDRFWLNLHHYLYVLGRAEMGAPDARRRAVAGAPADQERGLAALTGEQRRIWGEAVAFYAAGPSKLDTVFDREIVAATHAVAGATGPSLDGVELAPELKRTLVRAAPIYRAAFWPAHRRANEARVEDFRSQVERHGEEILSLITGWYQQAWPAGGFPVHLSAFTNWAGAYSTSGNLLVVSSLDPELAGSLGLETIFHEAMHQWDDAVGAALAAAARAEGTNVPRSLSHAMIFYTAGEAARRAVPGHVPYAERSGVWRRRSGVFLPALQAAWQPYLDGKVTREAALEELVRLAGAAVR